MADIPTPRSQQQILGDQIDAFLADFGITNLRAGSPILSILEAASTSDFRASQQIFALLNAISLDRAKKQALDRIGADERVPRHTERPATGRVTISDSSFTKKSTRLFQGSSAPIVGSVSINVVDASDWPASGQLYIGRGTLNYEGPLSYTSKTDNGTYWTLALSTPTTKFHNASETVILAQGGNREIAAGSICSTPQANISDATQFKTVYSVVVPDGETSIEGVEVICLKNGLIGNVPAGAISVWPTPPFTGATVTNPKPFSNARETEKDEDYRERIRDVRQSRQKATPLAITTGVTGITAIDENKSITSASIVTRTGYPTTLYIDDGTGYEEISSGIPVETVVDSALGGEQYFQVTQRPIAKAYVESQNSAPYALTDGQRLEVEVGGTVYTHVFDAEDFINIASATAYEVVSSINSNPEIGFSARTTSAGTKIAIFAKEESNEWLQVLEPAEGDNANDKLLFPAGIAYTTQVYKNDRLLSKDGLRAVYKARPLAEWTTFSGSQTLTVAIDGTAQVTYTFTDQDFIDADVGFAVVGKNTVDAWVEVINRKIPGVTAENQNGVLTLISNVGFTARAAIEVVSGSLVVNRMFDAGKEIGADRDYTLDRNTGQLRLEKALAAGDRLTIGSPNTRSFLESAIIPTTSIVSDAKLWFVVDGDAQNIKISVSTGTLFNITVDKVCDWGYILKVSSDSTGRFNNVKFGDWAIVWDASKPALAGGHRIIEVDPSGQWFKIERRSATASRYGHRVNAFLPVASDISKVLISGGYLRPLTIGGPRREQGATETCEIFDPNTNTVSKAASMSRRRCFHSATMLNDGRVFVAGGMADDVAGNTNKLVFHNTTEIYDPTTDTWILGPSLPLGIAKHAAIKLADGRVAIIGGWYEDSVGAAQYWNGVYIYDPNTNALTNTGVTVTARSEAMCALLNDGRVLITGGYNGSTLTSTHLFNPAGPAMAAGPAMNGARRSHGIVQFVQLGAEKVMVAGDGLGGAHRGSYEIYDVTSNTWGSFGGLPIGILAEEPQLVKLHNGNFVLPEATDGAVVSSWLWDTTLLGWTNIAAPSAESDSTRHRGRRYVLLSNLAGTYLNRFVGMGGVSDKSGQHSAAIVYCNANPTAAWSYPDSGVASGTTLSEAGLSVVRTINPLQEVQVPVGSSYTASSFVTELNKDLRGATASVYRTNRLRVATNSFGLYGDIAVVAQNTEGAKLKLTVADAVDNLTGHVGSVESGNSDVGTPEFYQSFVFANHKNVDATVADALTIAISNTTSAKFYADHQIVGLRALWSGLSSTVYNQRFGSNYGFISSISSVTENPTITAKVDLRQTATQPWTPYDRVFWASPFAMTYEDDLSVLVDGDVNKRFAIKMSRKLKPAGATYAATNAFKDADASNASLATTFGLDYSFDDFAVWMKARAIAFTADATRKVLFRSTRPGPDGEHIKVRFANPKAPSAAVAIESDNLSDTKSLVRVRLAGGAERSPTIRSTTKLGFAYPTSTNGVASLMVITGFSITEATRVTNLVTCKVQLQPGVTGCGLTGGDRVWVQSTHPDYPSGVKIINTAGAVDGFNRQTVTYFDVGADAGIQPNIGTMSFDVAGEAKFSGASIQVDDFFRISELNTAVPLLLKGETFSITGVNAQYLTMTSGESNFTGLTDTTINWYDVESKDFCKVFANPKQTITVIAAAINAAAALTDSTCPITAVVLGAGSGTIDKSTPETLTNIDSWYELNDGINWVSKTVKPLNISQDYQLTFKTPIDGSLATGSDWINEEVWLVPITAKTIVQWCNTPAVTGLFTAASIQLSNDGTKVQIATKTPGSIGSVQVQGGLANTVTAALYGATNRLNFPAVSTVLKSAAAGLASGQWCAIDNTNAVPKSGFGSGAALVSWSADGFIELSTPVFSFYLSPIQARMTFEKQGDFVAISEPGMLNTSHPDYSSLSPGDYLRIAAPTSPATGWTSAQVPSQNQGLFRVVRIDYDYGQVPGSAGTIWIENPNAVEGTFDTVLSGFDYTDLAPGDVISVNTDVWGATNRGTWVVEKVGVPNATSNDQYQLAHATKFKVSTADRTPSPISGVPALGAANDLLIRYIEGSPSRLIKKIDGIAANPTDGRYVDIRWDNHRYYEFMSASAGSVISALDKLAFSTDTVPGIDGYRYNTGLIGEANRVVYGEPSDPATYPGIAAAAAQIKISGPLVKRIQIALQLRIQSGASSEDVAARVRSAVASVVNRIPIGTQVALSKVVAAAEKVVGVVAVTVVSPTYDLSNDLIPVQPFEKPLVLDLESDVQISFTGE